jgi:hypothetical protein
MSRERRKEHRPRAAEVIAGGQTSTTHCLACGHRGELDPRVLAVVEGESTTMGAIAAPAPLQQMRRTVPAGRAADATRLTPCKG